MFDYGNTRLRAFRARLLSREDFQWLAEAGSPDALIDRLLQTSYRRPLERALSASEGIRAVERGVRRFQENLLKRLRTDFSGRAREAIDTLLARYDLHNLITILRGLAGGRNPAEIERAFDLFGRLDAASLRPLTKVDGLRAGIDLMAAARLPAAVPLIRHRTEEPGGDLFEFELVLKRWFFRESPVHKEHPPLAAWLRTLADQHNILSVLRLAHDPGLAARLQDARGYSPGDLLLEHGELDAVRLVRAAESGSVAGAIEQLARTRYGPALQQGLDEYRAAGRLGAFEGRLSAHHLGHLRRSITMRPLGMAVPIAVLALAANESANLRWIAWGCRIRLDPAEIKAALVLPA